MSLPARSAITVDEAVVCFLLWAGGSIPSF